MIKIFFFFLLFTFTKCEENALADLSRYNANKLWIYKNNICCAMKFSDTYPDFYGIDIYESYNTLEEQCKTLIIDGFKSIQSKARSLKHVEKVVVMDSIIGSGSFGDADIKEYLFLKNITLSKYSFKTDNEYIDRKCDDDIKVIDNFVYCNNDTNMKFRDSKEMFECVKLNNVTWNNETINSFYSSNQKCNTIHFKINGTTMTISGYGELTKNKVIFYRYYDIERIEIKEGIYSIDDYTFDSFNVSEIVLPYTLKYIGKYCFKNVINLEQLIIPPLINHFSFTNIEKCESLEKLIFLNSGEMTFEDIDIVSKHSNDEIDIYSCGNKLKTNKNNGKNIKIITQKNAECLENINCEKRDEILDCPIVESLYIPFDCQYDFMSLIVGGTIGTLLTLFLIFVIKGTDKIANMSCCEKWYDDCCEGCLGCASKLFQRVFFCFRCCDILSCYSDSDCCELACLMFCGNIDDDIEDEDKRRRKIPLKIIFYLLLTTAVLVGPIFSFYVDITGELEKLEEDQSMIRIIVEFITTMVFFAVTWTWFTMRFCCTCFFWKKLCCGSLLSGISCCSSCSSCCGGCLGFLVAFCACGDSICPAVWCLSIVIIVVSIPVLLVIATIAASILIKVYYMYQDLHGVAVNAENIVCAMISSKEGVEIDNRDLLDEFGDVAFASSEIFQTWNIILLIVIIIAFIVVYCRQKCIHFFFDCCNKSSSPCVNCIGKCFENLFCCCGCCESICCQCCMNWMINIAVEESFGNVLKRKMNLDEIPSEVEMT